MADMNDNSLELVRLRAEVAALRLQLDGVQKCSESLGLSGKVGSPAWATQIRRLQSHAPSSWDFSPFPERSRPRSAATLSSAVVVP